MVMDDGLPGWVDGWTRRWTEKMFTGGKVMMEFEGGKVEERETIRQTGCFHLQDIYTPNHKPIMSLGTKPSELETYLTPYLLYPTGLSRGSLIPGQSSSPLALSQSSPFDVVTVIDQRDHHITMINKYIHPQEKKEENQ